jgi:DNA-binding NarL/FixJ family response regulator
MTQPEATDLIPIKVLHIEDDTGTALLVRLLLESVQGLSFEVIHRTTLKDGLDTWHRSGPYDVVLLDLSLPDSYDLNTVRGFVQGAPGSNVIVMTGQERGSIGIESVKAGAQDFLAKGDDEALVKSIRYSLERQSILVRLAETQRMARIGSFEYEPDAQHWFFSDEVYAQFDLTAQDALAQELEPLRRAISQASLGSDTQKIIPVEFQAADGKKYFDVLVKHNRRSTGGVMLQGYL